MILNIDFLAVLGASVAAFAVGALWYGPVFGAKWKMLMGYTDERMKAMKMTPLQAMSGGFVATVVMVFVLAAFLPVPPALTVGVALTRAFLIWLGFIATIQLNSVWYEERPVSLYVLNTAHSLVALLVAALVFAWWPW